MADEKVKTIGEDPDDILLEPIFKTGRGFYITVGILLAIVAWAGIAYMSQLIWGLGVTNLNRPVYWGMYITNFVFFIGISHAGTLISAILRIAKAEWRRAITRSAEIITVMVLFIGAANPFVDMGRPDRLLNPIIYGRFQSPLLWDMVSITTYLTASTVYLYIPMIPDIALIRDRSEGKIRKLVYSILALGWEGTPLQWKVLERLIAIMAIVVIPVAVSVHTVVSYVFAMTVQPMWHSTVFGPYFVAGAIFSGIAALIIAMAVLRKAFNLENYIRRVHFENMSLLLLVMTLLWFYFTFCEYITTFYGAEPVHMAVFWEKFSGRFSPYFWVMCITCFVIPFTILCNKKTRTITGIVIASVSVTIGMWLERFCIIVPTLANPRLPYDRGNYFPSWVEFSEMAGCFAGFILLYVLFTKFFPVISIWEIKEGRKKSVQEVSERVESYLPGLKNEPERAD
ncbi:MAG: polysulfide reductase NrfD [Candidatus Schekmanbacteria bacterium]|nr:polysulfide reductase NrfD [Candidatus Schekmanbacteria bacterium]